MSWPVGSLLTEFASVPLWVSWSSSCPRSAKNDTVFARNGPASSFGHSMVIMPTSPRFCMVTTFSPWKEKENALAWKLHAPTKTCGADTGSSAIKHNAFRKSPPPQQAPFQHHKHDKHHFPSSGQRNQGASMPKDAVVAKRVEAFEVILLLVR